MGAFYDMMLWMTVCLNSGPELNGFFFWYISKYLYNDEVIVLFVQKEDISSTVSLETEAVPVFHVLSLNVLPFIILIR